MGEVTYDFAGETALVTGGSSGIGRAMALAFAEAGAAVVIADVRSEPKGADTPTHETIEDDGGTAEFVQANVSVEADLRAAVDRAGEFGGVDVMCNNAGILTWNPLLEVTEAAFDRIYAVNVKGVFFGTKLAAADMIDRGEPGVIVNTASINSNLTLFDHVPYDTTKGAVRMLTRGAALELAGEGIRVNAVAPGHVATELSGAGADSIEDRVDAGETIKPIPLGSAASPNDVADATLFLASEAAGHVTGELLYVDGGYRVL